MKKILLPVLSFITISTFAQITIDSSNVATLGDVIPQIEASTSSVPSVTAAATGTNHTWNFSTIDSTGSDTLPMSAKSTGYGNSYFPNANMVVNSVTDTASIYLLKSNTEFTGEGVFIVSNGDTIIQKLESEFIKLPSTYNTTFTKNSADTLRLGTGRMIRHQYQNGIVDGWGTAQMPSGNFSVIKEKVITNEVDSIQAYIGSTWINIKQTDTTKWEYYWWTNDPSVKRPLVDIKTDTMNMISSISWINAIPDTTLGIKSNKNTDIISVYPNPAKTQITFTANASSHYNLTITTIDGKIVSQHNFIGRKYNLDLGNLSKGIYFYTLRNAVTKQNSRGKFVKTE